MPMHRHAIAIAVGTCLAATSAFAQTTVPTAADLLPLRAGNRWTYTETEEGRAQPPPPRRIEVIDEGGASLPDGERVEQWRVEVAGAPPAFAWWSVRDDGIHRRLPRDASRRAAFDREATPLHWLMLPATKGGQWSWTGRHDVATDDQGRPFTHTATCVATDERVIVPAGAFVATHVRVDSALGPAGRACCTRDLWFVPGTGIVRDVHQDAARTIRRELAQFRPASDDREARLRQFLERELARPGTPAWNNPPGMRWLDDGAETLLVPGAIAAVEGESGSALYYLGSKVVVPFRIAGGDHVMLAAREAFGSDTALPPENLPVTELALLLARAEAHRRGMERVHPVPVTLAPPRKLPADSHRQAAVQVAGGARDGTTRHVALWLTVRRSCDLQLATDFDAPSPGAK